jgi:hypothetical protein
MIRPCSSCSPPSLPLPTCTPQLPPWPLRRPRRSRISQNTSPIPDPTGSSAPPGAAKRALIRRYLELDGIRQQIDSGSFLDRFAYPGGPLAGALAAGYGQTSFREAFTIPKAALLRAYAPRLHVWQREYESHVDQEYSEAEVRQIVVFLESNAGRRFVTGEQRIQAYVGTNTEKLLERILRQAEADLRGSPPQD